MKVLCALILLSSVAWADGPKDVSRVPRTGDQLMISYSGEVCRMTLTAKQGKHKTRLHLKRDRCYRVPAWMMFNIRVSWSNVFFELQRARECGVQPFTTMECPG